MRPHRLLRASSAQSVCAFCACRLHSEIPSTAARAPLALHQRKFGTSQSLRQDGKSASSPAAPPAWGGFDPNSSLSASEQKEKAMRQARRREAEAVQAAQAAAAKQRAEEEERRQHEAQMARRQRMQQAQGAHRATPPGRHSQAPNSWRSGQGQGGSRGDSVFRRTGIKDGNAATESRASGSQQRQQYGVQDRRGAQPRDRNTRPLPSAPLPSFMQTAPTTQTEKPKTQGWGAGSVERKSLEYGRYELEPKPDLARESARSDTESIHDVLSVGRSSKPQSSVTTYKPEFPQETQNEFTPPQTRAQTINRQQYRFDPPQDEYSTEDNWQHLRRRQSYDAQPQATQDPFSGGDDSWVDRSFAEHREARNSRVRPTQSLFSLQSAAQGREQQRPSNDPFSDSLSDHTKRTCGRCGQKGHVARFCSNQVTTKCHHCGQVGHTAARCPTNPERMSWDNKPRAGGRDNDSRYERASSDDSWGDQRGARKRGERFIDPRREMMERLQSTSTAEAQEGDGSEEPAERVLKSRKFRDDEPRKERAPRRGRRDDDEYDGRNDRRSRRDRDFEDDERYLRKLSKKEAKDADKKARRAADRVTQQEEQKNQIKLPEFISVQNLAQALGVRYEQFVNRLEDLGYDDVFPGQVLNTEVSGMIAMEYDLEPIFDASAREEEDRDLKARPEVDAQDKELLPTRPPVVTIMGHVDHGKTTILDYLRNSSVAAGEAGGITQHIGAFSVPLSASGKTITFLDTPGHAAFLAMRQRGANVTDIVILVVAADDSVKPQTLEAIKHAKGAGVPMLVAVNKVDKDSADVQRVKQDLARHGVEIEDFGGDTQVVEVSGKTGQGMDELEEATVTLSEILDHRADTEGAVEGWVLEATTKKAGRVATVLVRRGTLRQGAVIVAGNTWARVRTLRNEAGVVIDEAGPGMPVEVDGWRDQPAAGDEVLQAPTEQKAVSVVEYRDEKAERQKTAEDMEAINEARRLEQVKREQEKAAAQQAKLREKSENGEAAEEKPAPSEKPTTTGGRIEVPFIIKADVSGSVEAVEAYIMGVSSPMVGPRVLATAVGPVHESDVELAATTQGHIIAFNLPPNEGMKGTAERQGVQILENNIIYRVIDDVKAVLEEKLPPIITQRVLGEADIGMAFDIGIGGRKKMKIAGCKVRNGVVGIGTRVRVMRGDEKVYDGTISSLKNVKKDVQEMRKGTECGMGFEGWQGFEVGDTIQTYEEKSEKRYL